MYINVKHNIDLLDGGIEIDSIIRVFAKKLGMKEGNYSKYQPCYECLQYEDTTMKQFSTLKNSKFLLKVMIFITSLVAIKDLFLTTWFLVKFYNDPKVLYIIVATCFMGLSLLFLNLRAKMVKTRDKIDEIEKRL